mgnify:CR=1 FL=1
MKVLSKKPLAFQISHKELLKDNPTLNLNPEHHALKHGLLKEVLECRLCGKILPNRSVNVFMEHLIREHNTEFIDRCETTFYKKKLIPP